MSRTVTQGHLVLVCPDRPYELAPDSEQAIVTEDGKPTLLMAGDERHTLSAATAQAFVGKRVGGRHVLRGVRVAKRTVMKCQGVDDVSLAAGTWYVVEA